jgi:hypothetical protein
MALLQKRKTYRSRNHFRLTCSTLAINLCGPELRFTCSLETLLNRTQMLLVLFVLNGYGGVSIAHLCVQGIDFLTHFTGFCSHTMTIQNSIIFVWFGYFKNARTRGSWIHDSFRSFVFKKHKRWRRLLDLIQQKGIGWASCIAR